MHATFIAQTSNFLQHIGEGYFQWYTPMRELRAHISHKYSSLQMHQCEKGKHGAEDAICILRCISAQSNQPQASEIKLMKTLTR